MLYGSRDPLPGAHTPYERAKGPNLKIDDFLLRNHHDRWAAV